MDNQWVQLAVQAGGAIAVCAMFLFYLHNSKKAEDAERQAFMDHLENKDKVHSEAIKQQMDYLSARDAQSREIAQSGHQALRDLTQEITKMSARRPSVK